MKKYARSEYFYFDIEQLIYTMFGSEGFRIATPDVIESLITLFRNDDINPGEVRLMGASQLDGYLRKAGVRTPV